MRRVADQIIIVVAGVLCGTFAPGAEATVYGNLAGCERHLSGSTADDRAVNVLPDVIEFHESSCELPDRVDYSGKPMTLSCAGEGEEWSDVLALLKVFDGVVLIRR